MMRGTRACISGNMNSLQIVVLKVMRKVMPNAIHVVTHDVMHNVMHIVIYDVMHSVMHKRRLRVHNW